MKICYFLCSLASLFNNLKYHVLLVLHAPKIYLQFTEMFQSYIIKFLWHLFCSDRKRKFSVTYALLDLFCIPDLDVPDTLFGFVYAGTLLDMSDQSGVSDNCFDFRTRTLFS